jgi:hypothetical protein
VTIEDVVDRIERAYTAARAANLTVIRLEVSRLEYDELCRSFGVPELRLHRRAPVVVGTELRLVTD